MPDSSVLPELKQILGAMIFAANRPLTLREMSKCLRETAEEKGGEFRAFGEVKDKELRAVLADLSISLASGKAGCHICEVAGGYRLQSDPSCGVWVKHLLSLDKPARLSRPALETLAIIAYRQPVTRADIEGVRGVSVDHIVKMLLEMQLIRITGRSDLPGRPFLYGTTQRFLEHFGLKDLKELSELDPMLAGAAAKRRGKTPHGAAEAKQDTADELVVLVEKSEGEEALEQPDESDTEATQSEEA